MTIDEVFALLSGFFHLGQSLSHGTLGPALTTGVIPILQFAWKWWRERSFHTGKAKLREQIVGLDRFLNAVREIASPDQARIRKEAESERTEAIAKLLAMTSVEELSAGPTGIRRWLLIYAPRGIASLILHIFFYVSFAIGVLIVFTVGLIAAKDHAALPGLGITIGMCIVIASIFREVAIVVDRIGTPNRVERWLLFYRPVRPSGWIPRVLFYLSLPISLMAAYALLDDWQNRDEDAVLGTLVICLIGALLRAGVALSERNRPPNRLERWLLLYKPVSRAGWTTHVLFYCGVILGLSVFSTLGNVSWDNTDDLCETVLVLLIFVGSLILSRICAVDFDPSRSPLPRRGRLRSFLLFYAPSKRPLWILHVLFYCLLDALVVFSTIILWDSREDRLANFIAFGGLSLNALAVREIASRLENARYHSRPSDKWLLLGPANRGSEWVPRILFYTAVLAPPFLMVRSLANNGVRGVWNRFSENETVILIAGLSAVAIAVSAYRWARSYDVLQDTTSLNATPTGGKLRGNVARH